MLEQALFDPVSEAQPWRIDPVTQSRISHVSFGGETRSGKDFWGHGARLELKALDASHRYFILFHGFSWYFMTAAAAFSA